MHGIEPRPLVWNALSVVDKSKVLHDGNRIMALSWCPYDTSDPQSLLASVSRKGSAVVSSYTNGRSEIVTLKRFETKKALTSVVWQPGGQMLAAASESGKVGIWRWPQGDLACTIEAHHDKVLSCAWSYLRTGVLYTGSMDQTAKIWEIPMDRVAEKPIMVLESPAIDALNTNEKVAAINEEEKDIDVCEEIDRENMSNTMVNKERSTNKSNVEATTVESNECSDERATSDEASKEMLRTKQCLYAAW